MSEGCCKNVGDVAPIVIDGSKLNGREPGYASPDGLHVEGRHPSVAHFGALFAYGHLPEPFRTVSAQIANTAQLMIDQLSDNPELSAGLRSLLNAKDSFVRVSVLDKKCRDSHDA